MKSTALWRVKESHMSKQFLGNVELDPVLTNQVNALILPVPPFEERVITVAVAASSLVRSLADALVTALNAVSPRELDITLEDIVGVFSYLISARAAQCAGMRLDERPQDIQVPAILNPVLASIGNYESVESNLSIRPVPAGRDSEGNAPLHDDGTVNRAYCVRRPENFRQVILTLRSLGVPTTIGLPRDRSVEDDTFYRYGMVQDLLKGPHKAPRPAPVLAFVRAMVEMSYCSSLYGDLRVTYLVGNQLRASIEDVVFRMVRGPGRQCTTT
jgi:hypothetical protein